MTSLIALTLVDTLPPLADDDAARLADCAGAVAKRAHGGPQASEHGRVTVFDGVAEAVAATIELHRSLGEAGLASRVRVAIHAGHVLRSGGEAIDRAARLKEIASGGQVLLSRMAADLVEGALPARASLVDLGLHRLRDLARPEPVFQLVHPDLPSAPGSLRSLDALPTNLPVQLTSFVGRIAEIADVKRHVRASRLVTIVGAGGSGKTRLALQSGAELLDDFPDGVWLVDLAPLSDPALVPAAAASALGLLDHVAEERDRPPGVGEAPTAPIRVLTSYLAGKRTLLILDNCEHLRNAASTLVSRLLRFCPQLTLLVTSREPLRGEGEVAWPLPPLSTPEPGAVGTLDELLTYEAARLFADRATAVNPARPIGEPDVASVAEVCHRLDGIPLAIELAASRARVLSPADLAARLHDRFRLLTSSSSQTPVRQQTLEATIDWSYQLLSEPQRALLRRLCVFAGGWTLAAAETVCSGEGLERSSVLDALTALVDRSLVMVDYGAGGTRYRLLETIREYAKQRLSASGEVGVFRGRHIVFFAALAENTRPSVQHGYGGQADRERVVRDRFSAELENMMYALRWAAETDPEQAFRLLDTLQDVWAAQGAGGAASRWLDPLLELEVPQSPARARALRSAALLAWRRGDFAEAVERGEQALAAARRFGDEVSEAWCLWLLGYTAFYRGADYATADRCLEQSLAIFRRLGNTGGMGMALYSLGWRTLHEGRPERIGVAKRYAEETLAVLDLARPQDRHESVHAHRILGAAALADGDLDEAGARFDEALAISREFDCTGCQAYALSWHARLAERRGEDDRATALHARALELDRRSTWNVGVNLVWMAGRVAAAGRAADAARLLGMSASLLAGIGYVMYPFDRAKLLETAENARSVLGEHGFAEAHCSGQGIDLSDAVDFALGIAREIPSARGEAAAAPPPPRAAEAEQGTFRREGDHWHVAFRDADFRLRDLRGARLIAELLTHPGREFHALELATLGTAGRSDRATAAQDGLRQVSREDSGPVLDETAKAAYRDRIVSLEEDLEEARSFNDVARAEDVQREIDALTAQLVSAVGLGGRNRRSGDSSERARLAVTKAIKAALGRIRELSPALGRHFSTSIRTGTFCSYTPDPDAPVDWTL